MSGMNSPEFDIPVSPTMELVVTRGRVMRLNAAAYRWLREQNDLGPQDALHIAVRASGTHRDLFAVLADPDGLKVDPGNFVCSGVDVARMLGCGQRTARVVLAPEGKLLAGRISATIYDQAGGEPAGGAQAAGSRATGPTESEDTVPEVSGPPAQSQVDDDDDVGDHEPETFAEAAPLALWCSACGGHRNATTSGVCPTCGGPLGEVRGAPAPSLQQLLEGRS